MPPPDWHGWKDLVCPVCARSGFPNADAYGDHVVTCKPEPWTLTDTDKIFLRVQRIDPEK